MLMLMLALAESRPARCSAATGSAPAPGLGEWLLKIPDWVVAVEARDFGEKTRARTERSVRRREAARVRSTTRLPY